MLIPLRPRFFPALLLVLLACTLPAAAQKAQPTAVEQYQDTVRAFDRGQLIDGMARVQAIQNPLLRKLAQGALMAQPDTPYGFAALNSFISANPSWPDLPAIQQNAEKQLPAGMTHAQLLNWFKAHPPLRAEAFDLFVASLRATGEKNEAQAQIHDRWINGSFGSVEQSDFLKRYRGDLSAKHHWSRLDRLLWENTDAAAARMLPLVGKGQAALARARLHFTKRNLARVPAALARDPGLVYLKLKQARQNDQDAVAVNLLSAQPENPAQDDLWWNERSIIARRYLINGAPQKAYQIAARHRLTEGQAYTQAEFLAGWIALRFLHQPDSAITHFKNIYDNSSFPISRARGGYWLGRAYDAKHGTATAQAWYAKAAAYPTTFYGQVAQAALTPHTSLSLKPDLIAPEDQTAFAANESVRIAQLMHQIGERKRAEEFILALASDTTTQSGFIQLARLAIKCERYDLAVRISKRATQRGFLLDAEAYPVPDYLMPDGPERALVLALIRQESMFNPTIQSPAQAVGLMQLLPSTGRATARQLGLPFSTGRLTDATYNIRLGSRFLADRLQQFNGATILAVASYNAGPARVRQWLDKIGDPRLARDAIDWIELIPVYETRNYVQRVLEGTQIYRALLRNGAAPLRIMDDLAAGKAG